MLAFRRSFSTFGARRYQYCQVKITNPNIYVDLTFGQPSESLLPLDMMRQAAAHKFAENDPTFLQYGMDEGYFGFRQSLAQHLNYNLGRDDVDPATLFVTNGNSGALDLITRMFTQPGDVAVIEEPTYFLAGKIITDHHVSLSRLPVGPNGLDVDRLERKLRSGELRPRLVYTIPVFQNPTGVTLSHTDRVKLASLSQEFDFIVAADEVYQLLSFPRIPLSSLPPPMYYYNPKSSDDQGNLISMGSFSKIVGPGLRLGWLQAPPWIIKRLASCGVCDSGGGFNPIVSGIVHSAIDLGLQDKHLAFARQTLSDRCAALCRVLRRYCPQGCEFVEPDGGYFVWMKLPDTLDGDELLKFAIAEHKVKFMPGSRTGPHLGNYVRLCFAFYDQEFIELGGKRLGEAITHMLQLRT